MIPQVSIDGARAAVSVVRTIPAWNATEGLLADGIYLDAIELEISMMPGLGTVAYVYDEGAGFREKLRGRRQSVIYLPMTSRQKSRGR